MTPDQRFHLAGWLSDRTGRAIELTAGARLTVGHSREMWLLTSHEGERFVARVEQGGVFGTTTADEVRCMTRLRGAGVAIPRILASDPEGVVIGQPLFVMEYVAGTELPQVPAPVLDDFVHRLHELHRLPTAGPGGDDYGLSDADQVDHWYGLTTGIASIPLLDEAVAWLRANRPAGAVRTVPVHGDAGPGNFVHDGERLLAFTDWEFAHLGDPAEDWVFVATVRGVREMPTDDWRRRIEQLTGWSATAADWRYWELLNAFKGACANLTALPIFERGETPRPDLLTVGTAMHHVFLRRVVELVHAAG